MDLQFTKDDYYRYSISSFTHKTATIYQTITQQFLPISPNIIVP